MAKLLLIEDSKEIQDLILSIMNDRYAIELAETVSIAEKKLKASEFDLVLLDLGLPDGSGYEICAKLEGQRKKTPVMVLSAHRDVVNKVQGFELGIEDYIEKPFNPLEFRARVDAKIRKLSHASNTRDVFTHGPLIFDLDIQTLVVDFNNKKIPVAVTPIEFKLLLALCRKPGVIQSRQDLVKSIWSDTPNISQRGIDTHISHIRKKLDFLGNIVESQYGTGYKISLG